MSCIGLRRSIPCSTAHTEDGDGHGGEGHGGVGVGGLAKGTGAMMLAGGGGDGEDVKNRVKSVA